MRHLLLLAGSPTRTQYRRRQGTYARGAARANCRPSSADHSQTEQPRLPLSRENHSPSPPRLSAAHTRILLPEASREHQRRGRPPPTQDNWADTTGSIAGALPLLYPRVPSSAHARANPRPPLARPEGQANKCATVRSISSLLLSTRRSSAASRGEVTVRGTHPGWKTHRDQN